MLNQEQHKRLLHCISGLQEYTDNKCELELEIRIGRFIGKTSRNGGQYVAFEPLFDRKEERELCNAISRSIMVFENEENKTLALQRKINTVTDDLCFNVKDEAGSNTTVRLTLDSNTGCFVNCTQKTRLLNIEVQLGFGLTARISVSTEEMLYEDEYSELIGERDPDFKRTKRRTSMMLDETWRLDATRIMIQGSDKDVVEFEVELTHPRFFKPDHVMDLLEQKLVQLRDNWNINRVDINQD